ncbi:MAG: hypothetical protein ACLFPL_05280 [Candidatus Nanoarchaeia archaeon]
MNYKLIIFFVSLLFSTHLAFSVDLILELEEGGCYGYENGFVQAYYSNDTLINSSDYEVRIFNGPLESMGILAEFEPTDEPYNIVFEEPLDYKYEIEANNNSLYDKRDGFIEIYECQRSSNGPTEESLESYMLEFNGNDLFQVTTSSQSDLSVEEYSADEESQLYFEELEINVETLEFVEVVENNNSNTTFEFQNSEYGRIWFQRDESWEEVELSEVHSASSNERNIFALQGEIQQEESSVGATNESISDENLQVNEENSTQSEIVEESQTNTESNSPSDEGVEESSFFSGMIFNYIIIILVGVVIFSLILYTIFAMQTKDKNVSRTGLYYKGKKEDAPKTLLENKVITFIEQNKNKMEPPEVLESLINQGYDKERVIEILWDYIEKNKQK